MSGDSSIYVNACRELVYITLWTLPQAITMFHLLLFIHTVIGSHPKPYPIGMIVRSSKILECYHSPTLNSRLL